MVIITSKSGDPEWEVVCPKCGKRRSWSGECHPAPPCPHCQQKRGKNAPTDDVDEAIALAEEIETLAEDLPDEGYDFGVSVSEKARSIAETVEERGRVTEGQMTALENMLEGLQRWFHD